jgi:hypothetical protein
MSNGTQRARRIDFDSDEYRLSRRAATKSAELKQRRLDQLAS